MCRSTSKQSKSSKSSSFMEQQIQTGVSPTEPLLLKSPTVALNLQDNSSKFDFQDSHHDGFDTEDCFGWNRNVSLTLAFTGLSSAGRSLWSQNVLSTYVFLLTNGDAKAVGMITSVMGMSQLVASFPTGYVADHYRRDYMLQVASVVGFVAVGITMMSLLLQQDKNQADDEDNQTRVRWLRIALVVWGIFLGITNTSLTALFADSTPRGKRSHYFTQRAILLNLGNIVGPLVAIALFGQLGNQWSIRGCAMVMIVGQVICLASQMLLCCLNDDFVTTYGGKHGHDDDDDDNDGDESSTYGTNTTMIQEESDDDTVIEDQDLETTRLLAFPEQQQLQQPLETKSCYILDHQQSNKICDSNVFCFFSLYPCKSRCVVPILVAISDVAGGLAAGMSIRYFPIFFAQNLNLSPVAVQWLYVLAPLLQSMLMKAAYQLSQRYGRCRLAILHKWIGISFMLLMVWGYQYNHMSTRMICIIYILRTAFMNSTSALTKSVLMDAVPKCERAKWSALESVNMFSWSGSAALGGLLVAYKGVLFNFCITAGIQFLASLPLLLLCFGEKDEPDDYAKIVDVGDERLESVHLFKSEDSFCDITGDDTGNNDLSVIESDYPLYTEPRRQGCNKV